MRFLYAILCVLLISWAAFGQSPKYTVENKIEGKVSALEAKVATLEKQVKALRDANYLKANPGSGVQVLPQTPIKTVCACDIGGGVCQCGNGIDCGCGQGVATTRPNTVCQNGVCRVVSSPTQQFSSCANGSCSGGQCSQSSSSGGWYLGKNLGRRR